MKIVQLGSGRFLLFIVDLKKVASGFLFSEIPLQQKSEMRCAIWMGILFMQFTFLTELNYDEIDYFGAYQMVTSS